MLPTERIAHLGPAEGAALRDFDPDDVSSGSWADITRSPSNVRFASQSGHAGSNLDTSALCQKRPNAAQQTAPLFDDFVCLSEQRRRKLEAERLGGREIYDEIKLSRLLDWDVARLGTVQNLVDIVCGAAVHFR